MKPVSSIFLVVVISIIGHYLSWLGSFEISLISGHEMLEFQCHFRSDSIRIGVGIIYKVVHVWGVECSW